MGNNEILDIRDKDFFNMVSTTEECAAGVMSQSSYAPPEGESNPTHGMIYASRNESVEDFYNGFDCDY